MRVSAGLELLHHPRPTDCTWEHHGSGQGFSKHILLGSTLHRLQLAQQWRQALKHMNWVTKPPVFLAQRRRRGENGIATIVTELFPIPIRLASLEAERGEELSTHSAHPTPLLSCLLWWWRRQLNLFAKNWKKKEARQKKEWESYFHTWSRSHQRKKQTLCLLSSLPCLSLRSCISKNNSLQCVDECVKFHVTGSLHTLKIIFCHMEYQE